MLKRFYNWLDGRYGIGDFFNNTLGRFYYPSDSTGWDNLGLVMIVAFVVQAITGALLALHYVPEPEHAFESIMHIMNTAHFGWLFRAMHIVGAHILVSLLFIHTFVVFYRAGYKRPRELNWVTGSVTFFIIMLFCITGLLLPWSQYGYWVSTILVSIPSMIPVVGEKISGFLRGDQYISGITLMRFYGFHIALLPLIFVLLIFAHVFVLCRTGYSSYDEDLISKEALADYKGRPLYKDGVPFYPAVLKRVIKITLLYFCIMFAVITFKADLNLPEYAYVKADPLSTPLMVRPPWYLLAPYAIIREVPDKMVAITILILLTILFIFWSFIDFSEKKRLIKRPILLGFFIAGLISWVLFTIWGGY